MSTCFLWERYFEESSQSLLATDTHRQPQKNWQRKPQNVQYRIANVEVSAASFRLSVSGCQTSDARQIRPRNTHHGSNPVATRSSKTGFLRTTAAMNNNSRTKDLLSALCPMPFAAPTALRSLFTAHLLLLTVAAAIRFGGFRSCPGILG
jgi:hypothetical protein